MFTQGQSTGHHSPLNRDNSERDAPEDSKPNQQSSTGSRKRFMQARRWRSGERFHYPLPRKDNPWKICHKLIQKYDHNMVKAQTDEVQNLLIFAGLFSAVVTSFTIESYTMLQENQDQTVVFLLGRISNQIRGVADPILSPSPFSPDGAAIRINTYWFVSLSMSLITVLLGTTCMQWLREYRHYDSLTLKDSLVLRNMRYEGLIKWKVPFILSLLPTLLQGALILFFAGILELMWTLNQFVTIAIAITIGLAMAFVIGTSLSPAIQYVFDPGEESASPSAALCPYKSPQSWTCLQIAIYCKLALQYVRHHALSESLWDDKPEGKTNFTKGISSARDWFRYDLIWSRTRRTYRMPRYNVNHDLVFGLRWVAATFIENMDAVQAIYHSIRELDPIIALSSCSIIRYGDFSMLEKYFYSQDSPVLPGDDDLKAMLLDQISASVLEFFVVENPQFELSLLPHRLELYTRSRLDSMRLDFPGLPELRCPDLKGMVMTIPDDLKVQYLFYVENLLLQDSKNPYITFYAKDIDAGWDIVSADIQRDPWTGELPEQVYEATTRFFRANRVYCKALVLPHVQKSRINFCVDKTLGCLDSLHHFYDLLAETADRNADARDLKREIELFVNDLVQEGPIHYSHPLFPMPNWCDLVNKCRTQSI